MGEGNADFGIDVRRYERADCTLFRIPPIDVSSVGSVIEKALVQAWEQGASADSALNYLLREGSITDKLARQISQSLQFQRQRALEAVNEEKAKAIGQYAAEKEQLLQSIEEALGTSVQQRQEGLQRTMGAARQQTAAYSATQSRLNELRTRVQSQISEFGGVKGYKVLSQIIGAVASQGEEAQAEDDKAYQQPQQHGNLGVYSPSKGADNAISGSGSSSETASTLEEIVKREKPSKLGNLWSALVNVVTFRYLRKHERRVR